MNTLEELKKRATAAEAVLIERVEALVRESIAAPDYRKLLIEAARKTPHIDTFRGASMRNPVSEWLDAVIKNIEKTES